MIVDQGYRGKRNIGETLIINADKLRQKLTQYSRQKTKQQLRRRAAIEPIIGHLKQDFRLSRNFLKGVKGDHINVLLAAAAHNIRKWMRKASQTLRYKLKKILFLEYATWDNAA